MEDIQEGNNMGYIQETHLIFEKGIVDVTDSGDFHAKLLSLQLRWEKLCSGFYKWFSTHLKKQFLHIIIQFAREGTNVVRLYHKNDIESLHVIEKRIRCFKIVFWRKSTPPRPCMVEVDMCFRKDTKVGMLSMAFLVPISEGAIHKECSGCSTNIETKVHKASEGWAEACSSTENVTAK